MTIRARWSRTTRQDAGTSPTKNPDNDGRRRKNRRENRCGRLQGEEDQGNRDSEKPKENGEEKTPEVKPRNKEQEAQLLEWIANVLGEKLPPGNYEDILKDGVVLCQLINKLAPGSIKKIQMKGTNFQLTENVQRFQAVIKNYGLPQEDIFHTADLFERRNIPQVTLCLYALGRITQKHPEFNGPTLGPKMADKNERTFTEDQLRASEGQLNLRMGYNKDARQSGHGGFGNTRRI